MRSGRVMKKPPKKGLKIVFITEYFPTTVNLDLHGGVEMRTYLIAKELARDYTVSVIAAKEEGKLNYQILENISVYRVGLSSKYTQEGNIVSRFSFIVSAILTALFKLDFNLIEGSGILGLVPALLAAKIKNQKCIAFIPDTFSSQTGVLSRNSQLLINFAEKLLINSQWDKIITISQVVKSKLTKMGVNPDKVTVIYPPIHNIPTLNVPKTKEPSLSLVSRLVNYKGLDDIIKATVIIKEKYPNITVNIVGDGPQKDELYKKIRHLGLEKNIKLLGFIKNHSGVLKIIKSSWIYISCSRFEGFGIALSEAMSLKVPFVATNIPVYAEITHKTGGLFYQPGDPQSLAKKILSLLDKFTKTANKLTKNNYKITNMYSLPSIKKETLTYYLL